MTKYFVTAIGTDSGKTVAAAILAEALGAEYWKPIQAGRPTDMDTVRGLVTKGVVFHPESHLLQMPASPHAAAKAEGLHISVRDIDLPDATNDIVIEGAGGVMVPINDDELVIDIAKQFDCEVILVSNLYLGSINHSLLTIDYLKRNGYRLKGIIFNGEPNEESERIILKYADVPCLLRIGVEKEINREVVRKYSELLRERL